MSSSNTPGGSGPQDLARALAIRFQQISARHLSKCGDYHAELVEAARDEVAAIEHRIANERRTPE